MSEWDQTVVPPSFQALYEAPGSRRLTVPRAQVAARHDFCEDLANMLTEPANTKLWELGVTPADVLERFHRGLLGDNAAVSGAEALWVVRRLAELLNWDEREFLASLPSDSHTDTDSER
jgi:hypothetical protein